MVTTAIGTVKAKMRHRRGEIDSIMMREPVTVITLEQTWMRSVDNVAFRVSIS